MDSPQYKPYDPNDATWLKRAMSEPYDMAHYWWLCGYIDDIDWMLYQFYWRNGGTRFSDTGAQYELFDSPTKALCDCGRRGCPRCDG
jgi:hypothetical protein